MLNFRQICVLFDYKLYICANNIKQDQFSQQNISTNISKSLKHSSHCDRLRDIGFRQRNLWFKNPIRHCNVTLFESTIALTESNRYVIGQPIRWYSPCIPRRNGLHSENRTPCHRRLGTTRWSHRILKQTREARPVNAGGRNDILSRGFLSTCDCERKVGGKEEHFLLSQARVRLVTASLYYNFPLSPAVLPIFVYARTRLS